MRFRPHARREEPEINLIPLIDVLLVILIFLMVTTTYSKYTELQIQLPTADAERTQDRPREIVMGISAGGDYSIDRKRVDNPSVATLATALGAARQAAGNTPVLIISADAQAAHQSVVTAMQAAREAGLDRLTFAAQTQTAR
ncbi:MAG TPA: biopolymer transporter ExbD [Burkholderiaceae bacterium]|nr:biopolymer transporter ExbD [Burkholderiaceae bacterium]